MPIYHCWEKAEHDVLGSQGQRVCKHIEEVAMACTGRGLHMRRGHLVLKGPQQLRSSASGLGVLTIAGAFDSAIFPARWACIAPSFSFSSSSCGDVHQNEASTWSFLVTPLTALGPTLGGPALPQALLPLNHTLQALPAAPGTAPLPSGGGTAPCPSHPGGDLLGSA